MANYTIVSRSSFDRDFGLKDGSFTGSDIRRSCTLHWKRKNRPARRFFEGPVSLQTAEPGNSFWRKQLPKHPFSLAVSSRIVQAKSRQNPVTSGLCQWRISVSARLEIKCCRRVGCRGRPRRGIPHMAKRATAHHSLLHLASVGLCNSGTGKPTAPLKKREAACPKG